MQTNNVRVIVCFLYDYDYNKVLCVGLNHTYDTNFYELSASKNNNTTRAFVFGPDLALKKIVPANEAEREAMLRKMGRGRSWFVSAPGQCATSAR